jgi:hypothetical protein
MCQFAIAKNIFYLCKTITHMPVALSNLVCWLKSPTGNKQSTILMARQHSLVKKYLFINPNINFYEKFYSTKQPNKSSPRRQSEPQKFHFNPI